MENTDMSIRINKTVEITVEMNRQKQVIEGWGTSLAWWGNAIGRWSDSDKKNELMKLVFGLADGIGLNIVRYNIGGGENPSHKHMRVHANVPGFQPAPGIWDWEADAAQRWVLQSARGHGANIFEAFSNAPPYWMTISGCAAGSKDGSSNLREEYFGAFIDYLVEVVRHFRDCWDITFNTISPMNEPVRYWWKSTNNQEGCHFNISEHERILGELAEKLKNEGLYEVGISGPDENTIEETIESFCSYSGKTKSLLRQINTHTYEGKDRNELKLLAETYDKKLWMSEISLGGSEEHNHNDMSGALELAQRIIDDIIGMEAAAWVYWQAVEDEAGNHNHGLIHANFIGTEEYWITKQFYAMGNFSRFIRPGYKIIDTQNENVLAAYGERSKKVVIVIVNNTPEEKSCTIGFKSIGSIGRVIEVFRTSFDENLQKLSEINMKSEYFSYFVRENSITTFVINDVVLG